MNDRTSSLQVTASDYEQGGNVILFQDPRFRGRYSMFDCTPGQMNETSQLSSIDFDNRTSSALIVRRFKAECPPLPISILLSDLAGQQIASHFIENSITLDNPQEWDDEHGEGFYIGYQGSAAFAHGADPIFTWDMWPSFSPNRMYFFLRVPIRIVLPFTFNYDVELRFWIYSYIDSSGTLRGNVEWYGAWVEGGLYTEHFLLLTMQTLEPTAFEVNRIVSEALSAWESLTFERLYYLPGRYTGHGHVNDGVRLVLVTEV